MSQGRGSRRALYWHDWKRTSLVLRSLWAPAQGKCGSRSEKNSPCHIPPRLARELFVFHASEFRDVSRISVEQMTSRDYFGRPPKPKGRPNMAGPGGRFATSPQQTERCLPAPFKITKRHSREHSTTLRARPVSPYTETACRQAPEKIRRLGAVPVFLVPPTATVQTEFTFRSDPPGTVISFNDARAYPNLYRTDARNRPQLHINKGAAEELTRPCRQ